jgi:hypothetical protein
MNHAHSQQPSQKYFWGILAGVLLALVAYHMPWHVHPAAVFSNNAFDLAEAVSLHPTVRAESPTLLTTLLLRIPLIGLALIATLTANQLDDERWRWIWRGIAVLIVLRLNPPIDFYPFGGGSENDQQLGMLMFGGLFIVGIGILTSHWVRLVYHPLMIAIAIATIIVSINGYKRATDVMESLALQLSIGAGIVLFISVLVVMLVLTLMDWPLIRQILPSKISRSTSTATPTQ